MPSVPSLPGVPLVPRVPLVPGVPVSPLGPGGPPLKLVMTVQAPPVFWYTSRLTVSIQIAVRTEACCGRSRRFPIAFPQQTA